MDQFSISQLAKYSGVKAHTIRAWEKRYNALDPLRTDGNTRFYNGKHLKRLLNLVLLKDDEKNLALLCSYSDKQLAERVKKLLLNKPGSTDAEELYINRFITAAVNFDEALFNKTYGSLMWSLKTSEAYEKVILPVMQRVGLLWSSEDISVPMEHFLSEMFKQKIYASIDRLNVSGSSKGNWILCLREGQFHELGLLMANLLLRENNKSVLYLGANTPADQLSLVMKSGRYENILVFESSGNTVTEVKKFLKDVKAAISYRLYVAGGPQLDKLVKNKNVILLRSVDDLLNVLK